MNDNIDFISRTEKGDAEAKLAPEQLAGTTEQDHSEMNNDNSGNGDTVIVPGENLAAKLIWIHSNVQSNGNYIIELNADESIESKHGSLSYADKSNITITLKGIDSNRIISLSSKGNLFKIDKGVTLILDNNITLRGRRDNDESLVSVSGALIMNSGSAIIDNINKPYGKDAKFMAWGGGVSVGGTGTFIMNGGIISGNTASNGGGVYVAGIFTMNEGTIFGNTSLSDGGGVRIVKSATFTKTGGTITGYTSDSAKGNVVIVDGRITDLGHAIVSFIRETDKLKIRCKDTTSGPTDNMSYIDGNFIGIWDKTSELDRKTKPTSNTLQLTEPSGSGSGCYIATCVYGSYDCPEVWMLRRYRDNILSDSWFGREFIQVYYATSPKIVELFGNKKWFNGLWKPILDKFVRKLQNKGIDGSPYSDM